MAAVLVVCPECGRNVAMDPGTRVLARHRWPVARLAEDAPVLSRIDGVTELACWPRCVLSGVQLDVDPPRARPRPVSML